MNGCDKDEKAPSNNIPIVPFVFAGDYLALLSSGCQKGYIYRARDALGIGLDFHALHGDFGFDSAKNYKETAVSIVHQDNGGEAMRIRKVRKALRYGACKCHKSCM